MKLKRSGFLGGVNRFRLMLTLGLAVVLPAAALIYVNFSQLRAFERDKVLEKTIHRDFQEILAITEKTINKKTLGMTEDARNLFPSPDAEEDEKARKLDLILAQSPWLSHLFLFDEQGFIFRTQPYLWDDKFVRKEHEQLADYYHGWFEKQGKMLTEEIRRKRGAISFASGVKKQAQGEVFIMTSAMFVFPQLPSERVVVGGGGFDPRYLKQTFFPKILEETVSQKMSDQGGNQLAMVLYPADMDMESEIKPIVMSSGWGSGKPEVVRKFDDVYRGLALGVKFQGTSIKAIGQTWANRSFWILACLSLLIVGGLVITRHIVAKEMALARLKSDFVSNVSHELRTPLALIRLYAETLELGHPRSCRGFFC